MIKTKLYESIISKAFKEEGKPFSLQDNSQFDWSGNTTVKRKSTGEVYDVGVHINLSGNKRMAKDVAACLCKAEGLRFDDLRIVALLDPKLDGIIHFRGVPGPTRDIQLTFKKFLVTYEKELSES